MKTMKTMLCKLDRLRACLAVIVLVLVPGCVMQPGLVPPSVTISPYGENPAGPLWAVVPLQNESGTSTVDSLLVSDAVVAAASEVRGISAVPLNRTIQAMRALELTSIQTPAQARMLARAMGVDGVLIGSITAYDPYDPPVMGLSLALYLANETSAGFGPGIGIQELLYQPTDQLGGRGGAPSRVPASAIALHLDAQNHDVLMEVKRYASGRSDPADANNWRRYTRSMALYTKFAAHQALEQLIQNEWIRLAQETGGE